MAYTIPTIEQFAQAIKDDLLDCVKSGIVPPTIANLEDADSYTDRNCLGGSDDIFGEIVTPSDNDSEHQSKLDAFMAIRDPAWEIVDAWIKYGALRRFHNDMVADFHRRLEPPLWELPD